jgi:hypothetical protein
MGGYRVIRAGHKTKAILTLGQLATEIEDYLLREYQVNPHSSTSIRSGLATPIFPTWFVRKCVRFSDKRCLLFDKPLRKANNLIIKGQLAIKISGQISIKITQLLRLLAKVKTVLNPSHASVNTV